MKNSEAIVENVINILVKDIPAALVSPRVEGTVEFFRYKFFSINAKDLFLSLLLDIHFIAEPSVTFYLTFKSIQIGEKDI